MTETPSIYKPHKPTRKIGDDRPFPSQLFYVNGSLIVDISRTTIVKAVVTIKDMRTNTKSDMSVYFEETLAEDSWLDDAKCTINYAISRLGYELVEIKYLAEVTVDTNMAKLFETIPEEERIVYKDELATE